LERLCKAEIADERLHQELDGLVDCIEQARLLLEQAILAIDVDISPERKHVSSADIVRFLADFGALLDQSDMAAMQMFAEMRDQLQELPDGLFDRLDAAMQDLDLEMASQICRSAQEAIRI
jgi:hypothetical protein